MELEEFRQVYPTFQVTDELCLQGRRDVMYGIRYSRRPKQRTSGLAAGEAGTDAIS
jgi:hypothetical protein